MSTSHPIASRICLGTAQMGMTYGVANRTGRPDDAACNQLFSRAIELGVLRWDTAREYGDAESRIGKFLRQCPDRDRVDIVSKLPSPPADVSQTTLSRWLSSQTDASLKCLGVDALEAWLIHDPRLPSKFGGALWDAMTQQLDRGAVRKIGISVYDPDEAAEAMRHQIGALQLTLNLLDQRFIRSGTLETCARRDITTYARSTLLQGIFSFQPDELPHHLRHLRQPLEALYRLTADFNTGPLDIALPYALSHHVVDFVVLGVDDISQLEENLARAAGGVPVGFAECLASMFADIDPLVVEPRRWPPAI